MKSESFAQKLEPYACPRRRRGGNFPQALKGGSFLLVLSFLFLLLYFVSCASTPLYTKVESLRLIENVPFFPQEDFQCGPAALAGVLNYWKVDVSPEGIASEIYSRSARGTLTVDMVLYAEKSGLRANQYRGSLEDLRRNIDAGHPLVVLVDEGFLVYQKNHFMVVIGYSSEGIIANSGRDALKFIPLREFLRSWERASFWTLLITPK